MTEDFIKWREVMRSLGAYEAGVETYWQYLEDCVRNACYDLNPKQRVFVLREPISIEYSTVYGVSIYEHYIDVLFGFPELMNIADKLETSGYFLDELEALLYQFTKENQI